MTLNEVLAAETRRMSRPVRKLYATCAYPRDPYTGREYEVWTVVYDATRPASDMPGHVHEQIRTAVYVDGVGHWSGILRIETACGRPRSSS